MSPPAPCALRLLFAAFAGWLCLTGSSARANDLPSYDLDSLTSMSSEVVEGKFIQELPDDHSKRVRVEVEAVYKGDLQPGQNITLTEIDLYKKGDPFHWTAFEPGDYLVLFLHQLTLDPRQAAPPTGTVFEPVLSGLNLVVGQQVLSFFQWSNPGPYVQESPERNERHPPPTLAEYRQAVADSIKTTDHLAELFAAKPSAADSDWLLDLLRRKQIPGWFGYGRNELVERAASRIANLHDLPLLWQAAPLVSLLGSRAILGRGFGFPEGRESLFAVMADADAPMEKRLLAASLLGEVGVVHGSTLQGVDYHSLGRVVGEPGKDNANFLTRIARLAADPRQPDSLRTASLQALRWLELWALGDLQRSPEVVADDAAAWAILQAMPMDGASKELRAARESLASKHQNLSPRRE